MTKKNMVAAMREALLRLDHLCENGWDARVDISLNGHLLGVRPEKLSLRRADTGNVIRVDNTRSNLMRLLGEMGMDRTLEPWGRGRFDPSLAVGLEEMVEAASKAHLMPLLRLHRFEPHTAVVRLSPRNHSIRVSTEALMDAAQCWVFDATSVEGLDAALEAAKDTSDEARHLVCNDVALAMGSASARVLGLSLSSPLGFLRMDMRPDRVDVWASDGGAFPLVPLANDGRLSVQTMRVAMQALRDESPEVLAELADDTSKVLAPTGTGGRFINPAALLHIDAAMELDTMSLGGPMGSVVSIGREKAAMTHRPVFDTPGSAVAWVRGER